MGCTSIPAVYADECKIIINTVTLTGASVKKNGTATCTAKCEGKTCDKVCDNKKAGTIKKGTFTQTTTDAPVPDINATKAPANAPTAAPTPNANATTLAPTRADVDIPVDGNSTNSSRYLSEKNTTIGTVKKDCAKAVSGAMTVKGSFFLISSVAVVLSLVNYMNTYSKYLYEL